MIPIFLQDALVVELKELFSGFKLKNASGDLVQLNVYPQSLPAKKSEDDPDYFPYVIARLQDGEDPDGESPHTCRILIICGVIDEDDSYQGYRDSVNILMKIYQHLFTNRCFDEKYQVEYPVRWSLPEEDTYPFYFGGIETNWIIGKITQKEDEYI